LEDDIIVLHSIPSVPWLLRPPAIVEKTYNILVEMSVEVFVVKRKLKNNHFLAFHIILGDTKKLFVSIFVCF
jgi:hypothetical protein